VLDSGAARSQPYFWLSFSRLRCSVGKTRESPVQVKCLTATDDSTQPQLLVTCMHSVDRCTQKFDLLIVHGLVHPVILLRC
jgi:hypothetical protein